MAKVKYARKARNFRGILEQADQHCKSIFYLQWAVLLYLKLWDASAGSSTQLTLSRMGRPYLIFGWAPNYGLVQQTRFFEKRR